MAQASATISLFGRPVARNVAIGCIAIAVVITATLLALAILAKNKVGELQHVSSAGVRGLFVAAALLVILSGIAVVRARATSEVQKPSEVQEPTEYSPQAMWLQLYNTAFYQGYIEIGKIYLQKARFGVSSGERATVYTFEKSPPDNLPLHVTTDMTLFLEEIGVKVEGRAFPTKASVWPYLPWMKIGDIFYIEEAAGIICFSRGANGIFEYPFKEPKELAIPSVTFDELVERSKGGVAGSILEGVAAQPYIKPGTIPQSYLDKHPTPSAP